MDQSPLIADSRDDAVGKVKRAIGAIDKLSIRLGVLLRRYPTIRLLGKVFRYILVERHDFSYCLHDYAACVDLGGTGYI